MNPLSSLGRLTYSAHMMVYPLIGFGYVFGYKPWAKRNAEKAEKEAWEIMPEAKPVDRTLFNPFTPIPYHNNRDLKYQLANVENMHEYLNENHLNTQDYPYKGYLESYDHDNKNAYTYNWTTGGHH